MPFNLHMDNDAALIQACKDGNFKEVQRLLPWSNPQAHRRYKSIGVRWAVEYARHPVGGALKP